MRATGYVVHSYDISTVNIYRVKKAFRPYVCDKASHATKQGGATYSTAVSQHEFGSNIASSHEMQLVASRAMTLTKPAS